MNSFFTHLWPDIVSQHPPGSISIDSSIFFEKKWFSDSFGANAGPNSHFSIMLVCVDSSPKWVNLLIINTLKWVSIWPTVWSYFKRPGRSVGNTVSINCVLHRDNVNHHAKCILQNAERGDDTTLLGSWHRSLSALQAVHLNVLIVDEQYVDDLPLSRTQQNSKRMADRTVKRCLLTTIFLTICTLS